MKPLSHLFLHKYTLKIAVSDLNKVIIFLHREPIQRRGIGMKTRRASLSTSSGKTIFSTEEELVNAHQQNFTPVSKKPKTGKSAAGSISSNSRKIRNVLIQDNEKTQLTQEDVIHKNHEEIKTLSSEDAINMAIKHLREADSKLSAVIEIHDIPKFQKCQSAFQSLAQGMVYQQLAPKAAATIYSRLVSLCGGEIGFIPNTISMLSAADMRKIGISERKASYIHDLASKFMSGVLSDSLIFEMDDDSLISSLTAVRGIGVWTVHMFMIFSLHRPDVLPVGDLGVRKGVQKLYGLKDLPKPAQMEALSNSWRPYRSIGSWYMWRVLGTKSPISSSE